MNYGDFPTHWFNIFIIISRYVNIAFGCRPLVDTSEKGQKFHRNDEATISKKSNMFMVMNEKDLLVERINEQLKSFHEKYPQVEIKNGYPFKMECHFSSRHFSL